MLFGLNGEFPENFGVIVPDYFFRFYSPVFTVLEVVYYWDQIVVSLSVLSLCKLAAATDNRCQFLQIACTTGISDLEQWTYATTLVLRYHCWAALIRASVLLWLLTDILVSWVTQQVSRFAPSSSRSLHSSLSLNATLLDFKQPLVVCGSFVSSLHSHLHWY